MGSGDGGREEEEGGESTRQRSDSLSISLEYNPIIGFTFGVSV